MEQPELIQSSEQHLTRQREIINLLVNDFSPELIFFTLTRFLADKHNINYDGSRRNECLLLRSSVINAIRRHTPFTTSMIGKAVKRDHATVVHAGKMHETYMQYYPLYFKMYNSAEYVVTKSRNGNIKLPPDSTAYMRNEITILEEKLRKSREEINKLRSIIKLYGDAISMVNNIKEEGVE